jgi:hypothetical protein
MIESIAASVVLPISVVVHLARTLGLEGGTLFQSALQGYGEKTGTANISASECELNGGL